ncbi:hypothetical protein C0993_012789 [Termitomyces sp. T159_Od127]|nr:hypothetical protein C0993_012789 [Termitomyces sp. T159_Od127]
MILDPREKMSYFKKYWPKDLQADVVRCVEEVETQLLKSSAKGLNVLLRELSDDENDEDMFNDVSSPRKHGSNFTEDSHRPWLQYFDEYMNLEEKVPDNLSTIKWWGVSYLSSLEPGPSSVYEAELEKLENNEDGKLKGEEEGWNGLLSDADEDEDSFDVDMTIDLDSN